MEVHLEQEHYQGEGKAKRNRRNGHSLKTINLDLAPFAFTVRARSARTVNAGFGGAKRAAETSLLRMLQDLS
jgi:hypothetical protein